MTFNRTSSTAILIALVLMLGLQFSLLPVSLAYNAGPEPIGTWEPADTLDDVMDVVVNGNFAYLAVYSFGLQILDISDPTSPVERGDLPIGSTICITYANNRVFIGAGSSVVIVNVANPDSPSVDTTIGMGSTVYGIAVDFPYIYVGASSQSFKIANQSQVISTQSWTVNNYWCYGVDFDGDIVYGATSSKGITAWNVSDKENPQLLDNLALSYNIFSVAVVTSTKVMAGGTSGYMALVDSTTPSNLQKLGDVDTGGGDTEDIVVLGDYAFVADWSLGACSVGVSGNTPSARNRMQPTARGEGITTNGTLIFAANNWELDIYSLSSAISTGGIFEDIPGFETIFAALAFCAIIFYLQLKKSQKKLL